MAYEHGQPDFAVARAHRFPTGTEAHYYLRIRMADNQNHLDRPGLRDPWPRSVIAVDGPGPGTNLALSASPNPTFGRVTASFSLPAAVSEGQLVVYDVGGRRVMTLLDGPLAAGDHRIAWSGLKDDGSAARPGVYFLRLVTKQHSASRKILLIR